MAGFAGHGVRTNGINFSNQVSDIINETILLHKEINPKKPKPPWMDKYCLKLVEEKYRAWKNILTLGTVNIT